MDTTTSVDGGTEVPQPTETTEAVAAESVDTSVNTEETTSQQNDQQNASAEETDSSQADDISEWAKKKGLPLDDPVKLATMYRDAERKMHEASMKSKELENTVSQTVPVEYTGDPAFDQYAQTVNALLIRDNVRDFFDNNPEAREFESKMAEIVTERPHLQGDLDALYALARNDPNREAELKQAGGREALTNLAQKQQAIPPSAGATNSGEFSSEKITSANVDELVAKNGPAWYEANRAAILKAAGMSK